MRPVEQQTILITGATDGLGRAVANELAARGATLLLHGRSEARGRQTLSDIRTQTPNATLTYYRADFDSLSEIRGLATRIVDEHDRLDVLLNNAALGIDPVRRITQDGLEATFQVDYLAPFMLSHLLEPLLRASAPSRIVNVASAGQASISFDDVMLERSYDGTRAYCQAKLAEIMLTFDHAANLAGTDVTVNCVHPCDRLLLRPNGEGPRPRTGLRRAGARSGPADRGATHGRDGDVHRIARVSPQPSGHR